MKSTFARRFRRHSTSSKDGSFFKKENHEQSFFGEGFLHDSFFHPSVTISRSVIQRKCEKCEEEKKMQRAEDKKEDEEKLQKKESASLNKALIDVTGNYINSLNGKGQSLPKQQQYFFGSKIGYDFNDVKIHSDKEAAESAKEVNAKAYAIGNNIVFNEGQYNPESAEGKKLLAHELTHVVQTGKNNFSKINRRTPAGFGIRGVFPDAASYPHTIFYEMDSAMIPSSEWYKVNIIAHDFAGKPITLTGTASEEGDAATNLALINRRIGGVDWVLRNAGHLLTHTRNPQAGATAGNKDYRQARNVEVVETVGPAPPGGLPPSTVDPCDKTVNPHPEIEPCGGSVLGALPLGLVWILVAYSKLSAPDATTTAEAARLFPGIPVPTITSNVLSLLNTFTQLPSHHACHNMCDPACSRPARMDPSTAFMTVCPDFINEPSLQERAETLIHESLHATPGVMSEDTAYLNTRLITSLTGAQALHNTDSYVLLIFSLNGLIPSAVPPADVLDPGMTAGERATAKNALAFLEQWLLWSQYDTSLLYDAINTNIGRVGGWNAGDNGMALLLHKIAALFLLTDPGAAAPFTITPTNDDKFKMAGMFDRYNRMMFAVYSRALDMRKAGISQWQAGLGTRIDLAPAFFALGTEDAVKFLFSLLIRSDATVPPALVNAYVEGGNEFRKHWSVGP